MSDSEHLLFKKLLEIAHQVRSERLSGEDRRLELRDVYTLCFYIARELHRHFPDVTIMVGDRATELGLVQHHWIELPADGVFLDPAYDEFDPFQPVRVGRMADEEFTSVYQNGMSAGFDVNDPRDFPEMIYRAHSAYDPERGTE